MTTLSPEGTPRWTKLVVGACYVQVEMHGGWVWLGAKIGDGCEVHAKDADGAPQWVTPIACDALRSIDVGADGEVLVVTEQQPSAGPERSTLTMLDNNGVSRWELATTAHAAAAQFDGDGAWLVGRFNTSIILGDKGLA